MSNGMANEFAECAVDGSVIKESLNLEEEVEEQIKRSRTRINKTKVGQKERKSIKIRFGTAHEMRKTKRLTGSRQMFRNNKNCVRNAGPSDSIEMRIQNEHKAHILWLRLGGMNTIRSKTINNQIHSDDRVPSDRTEFIWNGWQETSHSLSFHNFILHAKSVFSPSSPSQVSMPFQISE